MSFCVQARWWFWNDELRVARCEADEQIYEAVTNHVPFHDGNPHGQSAG